MDIGFQEIAVIAVLILLFYGKRLPEVSRNLGRMLANFKRNYEEAKNELVNLEKESVSTPPAPEPGKTPQAGADKDTAPQPPPDLPYPKNEDTPAG